MIYVFDLDNTLCKTVHDGHRWLYEQATPIPERIAAVNALYDAGHTIKIDSARGCDSGKNWLGVTVKQLRDWGVKYHTARTGLKFGGDVFVDDKGVRDVDFFKDVADG